MAAALAFPSGFAAATAAGPSVPGARSGATGDVSSDSGTSTGTWNLVRNAGAVTVSWTSPTPFPLTSDRPSIVPAPGVDGVSVGAPVVADDGRTVTATVASEIGQVDTADLDVVLSGQVLDRAAATPTPAPRLSSLPAPSRDLLGGADPGAPGEFATASSDYTLDPVKLDGMEEPIEMIGHVVEPATDAATRAATGPRPLVLFLHGRHGVCFNPTKGDDYSEAWPCQAPFEEIPSHLGYVYAQELLASQGYTTVSVRVNGINAQDYALPDGGADARAQIVARHLQYWVGLADTHGVDLDRTVLIGHSRGGEGVDRASIQIPLDAPYRIAGQLLLAPTDFASHTASYVPTVTVLPYCDGDVSDLQGQRFTDVGRDIAADDTSVKSSVLVMGANHNFFNTEWTPATAVAPSSDDWYGEPTEPCGRRSADRLSAAQQRAVGRTYIAAAVDLFTRADGDRVLPLFDGSPVTVASIGRADVYSHALGGGRDVRRPGLEATPTLTTSGATGRLCNGIASGQRAAFGTCGRDVTTEIAPHWLAGGEAAPSRQFFEFSWTSTGARGGLRFDGPLDLTSRRLELRTIADPRYPAPTVTVRLTDATGATVDVTPRGGGLLTPFFRQEMVRKLWAQTLIVDPPAGAGQDAAFGWDAVTAVELVTDTARGRVWIADLASAGDTLAPVPNKRLPRLSLGRLNIVEGDRNGDQVAQIPFTVAGEVTRPARVTVFTAGQRPGSNYRFAVDLAPGQTSGSIPVTYHSDRLDSYDQQVQVSTWAVRNIVADGYLGQLDVRDDDPTPKITVKPVSRVVREGESAQWTVKIAKPVGYDLYVGGTFVKGRGANLRGDDLPPSWLEIHGDTQHPTWPLWRTWAYLGGSVPQGSRELTLRLPIARDDVAEGRERVTVVFRIGEKEREFRSSVVVLDGPPPRARG